MITYLTSITSELAKVEYIYNKELTPQIKLLDSFFEISSKKCPKSILLKKKVVYLRQENEKQQWDRKIKVGV